MSTVRITSVDPQTGENIVIAKGIIGKDLVEADGNYYFMPEAVNRENLELTDVKYTCPYKGTCNYYRLINDANDVVHNEVTWVYETPNDGWEQIAGKYGFNSYDTNGLIVTVDGEDPEQGPDTDESIENVANQGGFE